MKRCIISMTIALLLVIVLAGTAAADDGAVTVTVDGVRVAFIDQEPVIIDNLIMVPLRGVFEALGFTVEWDNDTRTASATSGTHTVLVTIGSDIFTTNGETHTLEGPAQTIGDRTMVPIPAVLESVGVYVGRDAAARTVFIRTSPGPGVQTIAGMGSLVVQTLAGTGSHGAADGDPAQFNLPTSVFGSGDALFVADTYNNLIRIIDGYGYVKRFAGNVLARDVSGFPGGAHRDGAAPGTRFNRPTGGVVDEQGRIFIADSENHVIRVIIDENVFTFAGGMDYGYTGGPRDDAQFHLPTAIAIGPCGGLFITDTLNHIIRMICADGYVTTVAGVPGVYGYFCDEYETPLFNAPMGIAVDGEGRIFVADSGNHLIRVIENGAVRTLAGALIFPDEIDWYDYEDADFDEEPLGGFADGENALFNLPVGLAVWGDKLLVADSINHRIRAVLPCGYTFTLAGTGEPGHDDGCAAEAGFHFPRGLFVRGGRLYVADSGNNIIRVLTPVVALDSDYLKGA